MICEKRFASGESKGFRFSRDGVNGLPYILITAGCLFSKQDFSKRNEAVFPRHFSMFRYDQPS